MIASGKDRDQAGEVIKRHRLSRKMLLREASQRSGYDIHRWSRWERGLETPKDPLILRNIADTLHLNGEERLRLYEASASERAPQELSF